MRPRVPLDPDQVESDRAKVATMLERFRERAAWDAERGGPGWFAEAVEMLEVQAAAEVPDMAEVNKAWYLGYHIRDEQASAAAKRARP